MVDGIIDEVEARVRDGYILVNKGKGDSIDVNDGIRLIVTKLDGVVSNKDEGRLCWLLVNEYHKLGSNGRVDRVPLDLDMIIADSVKIVLDTETLDSLDVDGLRYEVIKKDPLGSINEDTSRLDVNGGNKVSEYGVEIFVVFVKLDSNNEVSKSDCTCDDISEEPWLNVISLDWLCSKDNEDKYKIGVGLLESNDVVIRSKPDTVEPDGLGSTAIV